VHNPEQIGQRFWNQSATFYKSSESVAEIDRNLDEKNIDGESEEVLVNL